jgi:hypothetical protein
MGAKTFALMLAVALAIGSCAAERTVRTYSGPKLPDSEIALLQWGVLPDSDLSISVREIDGTPLAASCCSAELLPGTHTLKADVEMAIAHASILRDRYAVVIQFEVLPGRAYEVFSACPECATVVRDIGKTVAE